MIPRGIEDRDFHEDFVLVNHGHFLLEFLRAEPIVDLPRVHVHQDVVGSLSVAKSSNAVADGFLSGWSRGIFL